MSAGTEAMAPAAQADHSAAAASLVVSVDELRAVCRVTDAVLPAMVSDQDARIEAVDVAALRGLAARGLVALPDDMELWVADDLLAALAPTRGARLVVEVDEDAGRGSRTWAALGGDTGPTTVMTEHGAGLVRLEVRPGGVGDVVAERCDLSAVPASGADLGFTVPRAAHETMGDALDDGSTGAATEALVAAGAPAEAAGAFVAALHLRRRAVAVQVARNLGTGDDGPFEAAEVRWVEGPDGTAWRLAVELLDEDEPSTGAGPDDAEVDEDEAFEARLAAVVRTVGRIELEDAIRSALTPTASDERTGDDR